MQLALKSVFVGLSLAGFLASQAFASSGEATTVAQQLEDVKAHTQLLERQLVTLQAKVVELNQSLNKEKAAASERADNEEQQSYVTKDDLSNDKDVEAAIRAHSLVSFGPYLNMRTQFDGGELITNTPSIRESARLLKYRHADVQAAKAAGKPLPPVPHLTLSGQLGGVAIYKSNYSQHSTSKFDLTDAELDAYIVMNDWISGFMSFAYDSSANIHSVRSEDNSRLFVNKAFMTLGNLEETPFYATLGQLYVPFGRYSSSMVDSPLTLKVMRTKQRALLAGYQSTEPNTFYGEVYAFNGDSGPSNARNHISDGGVDMGYNFVIDKELSGEIGVSAISTITDASGIQGSGPSSSSAKEHFKSRTPGVDVHIAVELDPFSIIAEYATATHRLRPDDGNTSDLFYGAGRPAKPNAFNTEAAYTFETLGKPSSVAIGYGHTGESVAFGVPNRRYIAAYSISWWKHTLETLEVRREYNYSESAGRYITDASTKSDLGKINNVITAQLHVYF